MANLLFLPEAWADYVFWQEQDKKAIKNQFIASGDQEAEQVIP